MNTQNRPGIAGNLSNVTATAAVDDACERIEQATINNNVHLVWIRVKDRLEEFLIEHNPHNFPAPVIPNRRITRIPAAHQTIMAVTKNVLARRVPIRNNTVEVSAIGAAGIAYFEWSISNRNELPHDETAAHDELVAIFRVLPNQQEYNQWRGLRAQWLQDHAVDHDRALVILRKYPNLASQNLDLTDSFGNNNVPYIDQFVPRPLGCMLASPNPPSLAVVKEVYQMDPSVLLGTNQNTYPATTGDTGLHYALDLEPCNEIVQFIFEQAPSALLRGHGVDRRPIDILLRSIEAGRANTSTLSLIMDLSPVLVRDNRYVDSTFGRWCDVEGYLQRIFSHAFQHYSAEIVSFIAERFVAFSHSECKLDLCRPHVDRPVMEVLGRVLKALPNVTDFSFTTTAVSHWSPGAAEKLLSSIIGHKLKKLYLHVKSTLASSFLLQRLLLTNTALELMSLIIEEAEESPASHSMVLQGIFGGLSANSGIQEFTLCGIPLSLSWQDMQIENGVNQSLEVFTVGDTGMPLHRDFLPGMLMSFTSLTALSLTFEPLSEHNYGVQSLHNILENPGNLEELDVFLEFRGPMQDFDDSHTLSICEALGMNSALLKQLDIVNRTWRNKPQGQEKLLEVLKGKNDTLCSLHMPLNESFDFRIQHYVVLNECGRKVVREGSVSCHTFIQLLCDAPKYWFEYPRKYVPMYPLSNIYGLLHENPGLWLGWCLNGN